MNLFDPLRPKLPNSRPTWLRNHIAIPHFEVFPLENNLLQISIWLPIKDQTFTSVRYTKNLTRDEFLLFLDNYTNDPEKTCEENFKHEQNALNPELRTNYVRFESGFETSELKSKEKKQKVPILNLEF